MNQPTPYHPQPALRSCPACFSLDVRGDLDTDQWKCQKCGQEWSEDGPHPTPTHPPPPATADDAVMVDCMAAGMLAEASRGDVPWSDATPLLRDQYRRFARAALAAQRQLGQPPAQPPAKDLGTRVAEMIVVEHNGRIGFMDLVDGNGRGVLIDTQTPNGFKRLRAVQAANLNAVAEAVRSDLQELPPRRRFLSQGPSDYGRGWNDAIAAVVDDIRNFDLSTVEVLESNP